MNDVALRWLTAGDPCAVPDLGALWIASEPVRLGTMPTATVGAVVVAGADAASTPAGARFAGAGFRADPSADASADEFGTTLRQEKSSFLHPPILFPAGTYRIVISREFNSFTEQARRVAD